MKSSTKQGDEIWVVTLLVEAYMTEKNEAYGRAGVIAPGERPDRKEIIMVATSAIDQRELISFCMLHREPEGDEASRITGVDGIKTGEVKGTTQSALFRELSGWAMSWK